MSVSTRRVARAVLAAALAVAVGPAPAGTATATPGGAPGALPAVGWGGGLPAVLPGGALPGGSPAVLPGGSPAVLPGASSGALPAVAPGDGATLTWSVRPTPSPERPDRPNFAWDLEPGQRIEDSIRVRNLGTEPLPLVIYASDAFTTSSGAIDLLRAGTAPTGVGAWTALGTAEITVPAEGFVDVPFVLAVPAGAEAGDHTGGIVTSYRAPGTDGEGRAVVVDRRLGSRMYVRVGGELHPRLDVTGVDVTYRGAPEPWTAGDATVTYTVTNRGNVRLGAEQVIMTAGPFGLLGRQTVPAPMPELLPGNSLTHAIEVAGVWPLLRTTAEVRVRPVPTRQYDVFAPDTPLATGTATAWSIPWPQLLTCLAAGLVAFLATRRRRSRPASSSAAKTI
ncbi:MULTISPECIES: WxL protein peptidoglycan domain-containing protein [Catenuloplanes]|uniref:DUF916 domain-containing protein n=1 Tax=Catenuloplanes niger TaxID=587534 RepID=A0AAE3ZWU5_9ACTN|nr:DUF916 domain-containing protein [Catenuloplanes niger]MDR7325290.1 hypothetical protein [Catenuloplanes niger]